MRSLIATPSATSFTPSPSGARAASATSPIEIWCCTTAVWHTHPFDVHGTADCRTFDQHCGQAGEFFD